MNVLLVNPPFKKIEKCYPLGLGYISSFLKKNGHRIWGADISFVNYKDTFDIIKKFNIDMVGISATSFNLDKVVDFVQKIKRNFFAGSRRRPPCDNYKRQIF